MLSKIFRINLIVAVDIKFGIAKNNNIPWLIKEDFNFFSDVTKRQFFKNRKNVVIMGKNTWKEIPKDFRGLPNRINIIISTTMTSNELINDNTTNAESYLVKTIEECLELCHKLNPGKVFVGGGVNIIDEFIKRNIVDEIYLTQISNDFNCDKFISQESIEIMNKNFYTPFDKEFLLTDMNSELKFNIKFSKMFRNGTDHCLNKNIGENQYLNCLYEILKKGNKRQTRNAITYSLFGKTMEFDLSEGLPISTTKKTSIFNIFHELLFFFKGDTNTTHLSQLGIKIWEPNTSREFLDKVGLSHYEERDTGPMYGYQWRHFGALYKGMNADYIGQGFDQIKYCLDLLKNDPTSRRIIMSSYNPNNGFEGVLFPCHGVFIQMYVSGDYKLDMMMVQRSGDSICGIPYNFTSYGLFNYMICEVINNGDDYKGKKLTPGRLIMNIGDIHIYDDHYSQAIRQILRDPYQFPKLKFKRKVNDLTDFKFEDLEVIDYDPYPWIPVKMVA